MLHDEWAWMVGSQGHAGPLYMALWWPGSSLRARMDRGCQHARMPHAGARTPS
jgi:hypothetical protein